MLSYKTFKQGGNRVTIGLQNLTREKIILKKGTKIARVSATNIVPPILAPDSSTDRNELKYMLNGVDSGCVPEYKKSDSQEVKKTEPMPERLDNLFSKLDLSGIQEWSEDLQQKVHNLVVEYQHLFALNDLELGKTVKVKHKIKLSNPVPFKDRYHRIPPHEFEEVQNHLQDMLKVGAIRKSVSLWASPVVLVPLMGENAKKKMNRIEWTEQCEQAFNKLKGICSDTPILADADYSKYFKVHTDASEQGLGAVLYQDQDDGTIRVIAYTSQNLTKSKKRYHSSKLEFLALKWSICERFHEYLYGSKFQVYTDNNPLTYILTTAKLDATGQWRVASLANYDFTIHYRSGKQNIEADALSRIQWQHKDEVQVKAILARGFNADTTIPIHFD